MRLIQSLTEKRLSNTSWRHSVPGRLGLVGLLVLAGLFLGGLAGTAAPKKPKKSRHPSISFNMVPAQTTCLLNAHGHVKVTSLGPVEEMDVEVRGLPPNTDFDFFVIQIPHGPFGLSWYQSDIQTDDDGDGEVRVVGRFNIETFIVAPGSVDAPQTHPGIDALKNPATNPVHTYHLGLWFNSPNDAKAAGCPGATTPFNGDHTAGVQVLNTSNFPDDQGPLRQLAP